MFRSDVHGSKKRSGKVNAGEGQVREDVGHTRQDTRPWTRRWRPAVAAGIGLIVVGLVSGCLPGASPRAGDLPSVTPPAGSQAPPNPLQGTADKIGEALKKLVASNSKPSTDDVKAAIGSFASQPSDIEVSRSKTPTGLDADSLQASVKIEKSCIVSGIKGNSVTTQILDVLPNGLCFIGDQR